jgi:hypothetical protein
VSKWEKSRLPSRRRPRVLTFLSVGVLVLSLIFLTRLILGLQLPDVPLQVPFWYIPLSGALWWACGVTVGIGLLRGWGWAPAFTRWSSLGAVAWYWADRLAFPPPAHAEDSWLIPAIACAAALAIVFLILGLPASRAFFKERSE